MSKFGRVDGLRGPVGETVAAIIDMMYYGPEGDGWSPFVGVAVIGVYHTAKPGEEPTPHVSAGVKHRMDVESRLHLITRMKEIVADLERETS